MPPWIVDRNGFTVAPTSEHVPHEGQHRGSQDERADCRGDIKCLEAIGGKVIGVAARHAHVAQPVLHQECRVESDQGQPEVQLTQPLVE